MYLLNELWYGNVTPNERSARKNSEYARVSQEANECLEQLMAELSPKEKTVLEAFASKSMTLASISDEDAFICGVRIGARFMLDVLGDYHSQLPQIGENN